MSQTKSPPPLDGADGPGERHRRDAFDGRQNSHPDHVPQAAFHNFDADMEPRSSFDPGRRLVTLTLGDSKSCSIWKHRKSLTLDELAGWLSMPLAGLKDGPCYTPALLKGHVRRLPNVEQIDIAVLDSDAGNTINEIAAAVRQAGLCAIVHSTHSHLLGTTEVSLSFLAKHDGDAEGLLAGKFLSRIIEGARKVGETSDGQRAVIQHAPCPRFRIIIPLLEPWRAKDFSSRREADEAWRSFIRGLAVKLGLQIDQACADPSRLFFLPRTRPGGPPHEFLRIEGEPVDLHSIIGVGARAPRQEAPAPAWMRQWAATHAPRFEVVTALQARNPGVLGRANGTAKRVVTCPFEDEHTIAGGEGTFAINSSQLADAELRERGGGFFLHCSHNACAGRDRLDLLSGMMANGWLTEGDLTDLRFLWPNEGFEGAPGGHLHEKKDDWPDPTPIRAELPPVSKFDGNLLPDALTDYVLDVADRQQTTPDFVAVAAVCALAALAGNCVRVRPKQNDDWEVVPNLWGAIIGRPSSSKSPAMRAALAPLYAIQNSLKMRWEAAQRDADIDDVLSKLDAKEVVKKASKAVRGGDREEAKRILSERGGDADETPCPRLTLNDATVEKLGELLNQNPHGLLLVRDELPGLLAKLESEEYQSDRAFYLESYNGDGQFTYDRIGRGTVHVENCTLSIIGGVCARLSGRTT